MAFRSARERGTASGRAVGNRTSARRPRASAAVADRLEPRVLLSGSFLPPTPFISEFLAVNGNGIVDADGDRSDWIEINNPTAAPVNLEGYSLTDDAANLGKWHFPAVTLQPGQSLTLFASGKDRQTPVTALHTNFSLDAAGEYLALVGPGGTAADVLSEYAPYPQQLPDVSYGLAITEDATVLVGPAAPVRVNVPADPSLGQSWTGPAFDDTGWTAGTSGVGFDVDPVAKGPGVSVRMVDLGTGNDSSIDDLREAVALLDGPIDRTRYAVDFDGTADRAAVNFGRGGPVGTDLVLPNGGTPANPTLPSREQYALRATASVLIPAGDWTINVNSDEGFLLKIPGVRFITRTNGNATGAESLAADDTLLYAPPRGVGNTFATFTVPEGGLRTTLRLDYFERSGEDSVELSVATGFRTAYNTTDFTLLNNGARAWVVMTTSGTQAVDFNPLVGTDVGAAMRGVNSSAYVRVPFAVDESDGFETLRLRMKYDDGFVAYLNGTEVARRNAPAGVPAWNAAAVGSRTDAQAVQFEEILLPASALRVGANVLAIQGLNVAPSGTDFLILPELRGGVAVSSDPRYFTTPTPGVPNPQSEAAGVVGDTRFSVDHGFYDAPVDVAISSDTPGAQIRYTTDGTAPTATSGRVYAGPVRVARTTVLRAAAFKPGYVPSDVDTQTYIFPDDVIRQANVPPAGFPPTGPGASWDYEMDPDVVNSPAYRDTIVNDLKSIPSMSLVMNPADLFGQSGIYTNAEASGPAWERPGSAELIYADGTREGFQIDAGVRIYGGVNRFASFPKHTFRLLFKTRYGASKLKYDLFGDMPGGETATDEFDTLVLRGQFNKSWLIWEPSENQRAQYVHDQFIAATQMAMGQPSIHQTWVHLYLNGQYWGLYNPSERPDASFAASYFGGEKENYDALNSSEPVDGNKDAWNAMMSIANTGLASPAAYDRIKQYLDVDNLIDYMLVNFYGGNRDWDDHNWYAARERSPDGRFRFINWDSERTLEDTGENRTAVNQNDKPSRLYNQLRANAEFRLLFADHVQRHMVSPGGALTPAQMQKRYREVAGLIDRAIVGESARWGDFQRPARPYTRDVEWVAERNRILNTYMPARTDIVIGQLRAIGLFPAVAAPAFSQQGGMISSGFTLALTPPAGATGDVYYTLDGSDPRLPGGAVSPAAVKYAGPFTLDRTTTVRARFLSGAAWSAANVATFTYDMAALRVTEIMYNPAPPAAGSSFVASDFEFLEVQNTGAAPLFVGGTRFSEGVDFTFGGLTLAAGERAVVVRNAAAFASRYGDAPRVAGTFTGALDDSGERLRLQGPGGQTILDFSYDDDWYPQTDGEGFSLVMNLPTIDDATAWGQKEFWRASNSPGGGPGAADPGMNAGTVIVNEAMTYADAAGGDFIELRNTSLAPVDVSGWYLANTPANLRQYRIPAGTVIPAGGQVLFTEAGHFGAAFTLADAGGTVYLSAFDPADPSRVGGYRDVEPYGAAERGVTFGWYQKGSGGRDFTAMAAPTPGAPNTAPLVGPVVINEIMYNPAGGRPEFVELYNFTADAVALHDGANGWRFTDGIDFAFPAGASIPAGGYALVVPVDPAFFRQQYAVPAGVAVYGPYSGALSDGGERVALARPGTAAGGGGAALPYVVVDRVTYQDGRPWPAEADGGGPSIGRVDPAAYGNEFSNWRADARGGTPGWKNFEPAVPASVVGRYVFYNRSAFDGNDPAATPADDAAVATDKAALLPGLAAAPANVTGFTRGLNGIMLDVAGLRGVPRPADFLFRTGTGGDPAGWAAAPAPLSITRRPGAGANGSDRLTLVWGDDAVKDAWLQVTVLPNAATTGLAAADVFYFGNLVGDTGDEPAAVRVNAQDLAAVKQRLNGTSLVTGRFDFNKDGRVNAQDLAAVKTHLNRTLALPGVTPVPAAQVNAAAVTAPPAGGASPFASSKRVWDETPGDLLA